jgi:hypothetical protein
MVPAGALVVVHRLLPGAPASAASSVQVSRTARPEIETKPPALDHAPRIHGRILDADGNAVEGATVRLIAAAPPYALVRATTTDASGAFLLPCGSTRRARVVADRDPAGVVSSAELSIGEDQTLELTLVLAAASTVRGTVVDGQDHPVEGATLSVAGATSISRRGTTDTAGGFRLTTVPLDASSLVATARGFKTAHVTLPERGDGSEIAVRVRLVAAPGVDGDVLDADGKPVKARIVACQGQPVEASATSADDGTFQLPASTIGCDAVAEHDELGSSGPVAIEEGRRLSLRLKPGGSIEGLVVDDRGSAVPHFDLGIEAMTTPRGRTLRGGARRTFDDGRGAFVWEKLAPGTYFLTVSAPGSPPTRSAAVSVSSGTSARGVRIVLSRGGVVAGHVYDQNHRALGGVDLRFDAVSSVVESTATAKTDEQGGYRLEGAPTGPFTLHVQKDGFRVRMISGLRVPASGQIAQDIALTALDGTATFEFGGIGAGLQQSPEGITFGAVFPGNPAARAGLLGGDRIVGIDAQDIAGLSVADVLQLLRGPEGTTVGITVHRPGTGQDLDVIVERAAIVR